MNKEYKVVKVFGLETFVNVVNDHLQQGWEPLGGANQIGSTEHYTQTLVRSAELQKD